MSHSRRSPPRIEFTEDVEYEQEPLNDEILIQQLYYLQDPQTFASTSTYIEPNIPYATDTLGTTTQDYSSQMSNPYLPNTFQHQIPWDFQDMSDQFATLATTSYDTLHAGEPNYPQTVFWEETVIPEGGVFPIDLPMNPTPQTVGTSSLFANSEFVQAPQSLNDPLLQQAEYEHVEQEPVVVTYSYDDDDIPRNDFSWVVRPQKHPWVQSGRAYVCPYDGCYFIVQRRSRHVHNSRAHGVPLY